MQEQISTIVVKTATFLVSYLLYLLIMGIVLDFWEKLKEPTKDFLRQKILKYVDGDILQEYFRQSTGEEEEEEGHVRKSTGEEGQVRKEATQIKQEESSGEEEEEKEEDNYGAEEEENYGAEEEEEEENYGAEQEENYGAEEEENYGAEEEEEENYGAEQEENYGAEQEEEEGEFSSRESDSADMSEEAEGVSNEALYLIGSSGEDEDGESADGVGISAAGHDHTDIEVPIFNPELPPLDPYGGVHLFVQETIDNALKLCEGKEKDKTE